MCLLKTAKIGAIKFDLRLTIWVKSNVDSLKVTDISITFHFCFSPLDKLQLYHIVGFSHSMIALFLNAIMCTRAHKIMKPWWNQSFICGSSLLLHISLCCQHLSRIFSISPKQKGYLLFSYCRLKWKLCVESFSLYCICTFPSCLFVFSKALKFHGHYYFYRQWKDNDR